MSVAVRILIGFAARTAAQFNFGVEVMLSVSYAHYLRVMLRLRQGANQAMDSIRQLGYSYFCEKCGYRNVDASTFPKEMNCPLCGNRLLIGGKLWTGSLYDRKTLKNAISEFKRRKFDEAGLRKLETIMNEPDAPLYYSIPKITKKMRLPSISPSIVAESLRKKRCEAEKTHFEKDCIKTNAGIAEIKKEIAGLSEQSKKV